MLLLEVLWDQTSELSIGRKSTFNLRTVSIWLVCNMSVMSISRELNQTLHEGYKSAAAEIIYSFCEEYLNRIYFYYNLIWLGTKGNRKPWTEICDNCSQNWVILHKVCILSVKLPTVFNVEQSVAFHIHFSFQSMTLDKERCNFQFRWAFHETCKRNRNTKTIVLKASVTTFIQILFTARSKQTSLPWREGCAFAIGFTISADISSAAQHLLLPTLTPLVDPLSH